MKLYWVYIMASRRRIIYIGFSGNIEERVHEHKCDIDPKSFCAHYMVHDLVYFEEFTTPILGINREKELKAWNRTKKIALINSMNPTWRDLSLDWRKPIRKLPKSDVSRRAVPQGLDRDRSLAALGMT